MGEEKFETLELKVNTGASKFRIIDENGEQIGTLKFNPSDTGMIERYDAVVDYLVSVKFDDAAPVEEQAEQARKIEDAIMEKIDYLLGYNMSPEIFSKCRPLTVLQNGDFFYENVLDSIVDLVGKATNQRANKRLAKIKKGVDKYKR